MTRPGKPLRGNTSRRGRALPHRGTPRHAQLRAQLGAVVNLRVVAAAAITVPMLFVVGVALAATGSGATNPALTTCLAQPVTPGASTGIDGTTLDAGQIGNAQIIYTVSRQLGLPTRAAVIAIATAMQESGLRNLTVATDHDSLGLFQQRPSQGWGSPAQLTDPVYASTAFYARLVRVPDWQTLPLTDAAQAVQKSAYPSAYAKWEPLATQLVQGFGGTLDPTGACPLPCPPTTTSSPTNSGSPDTTPDPGCLAGQATLARAATWLTAWNGGPVPYLSSANPNTWLHGYRRDCSGYASMALALPGPGLDTGGLAAHSTPIQKTDLRTGDLLINPAPGGAGHVVIFDHWTDSTMTSYIGYEQSGDGGTHHRAIPYPYFNGYQMSPYRFTN